ncbi:MAG: DUF2188 domain-containing protein [Gemmatimonadaceae bacterium]
MTKVRNSNNQHVLPRSDGWAVKKAGADKDTKVFDRQDQAIRFATKVAKNNESELFIHSRDGRIRERNTYGSDPHPPKG